MKSYWPLLLAFLLASCAIKTEYEVTVEAGDYDRSHVPVAAELDLPVTQPETPVCVKVDGEPRTPGQVERIDRQRAYLWWVIDEMAAGTSRSYTIDIGDDCSEGQYAWQQTDSMRTRLDYDDRPVLEYVHPVFDTSNIERTTKPFHHVYAPDGSRTITKGFGGLYPHHRGIFFGYSEIHVGDQVLNNWAASGAEHQQHEEVTKTWEGPVVGGHTARINWNDRDGNPFLEEARTVRVFRQPDDRLLVEFEATLETLRGPIRLEGDRQHAGVQFRAAQTVAENQEATRYLRPENWADLPPDEQVNDDQHVDLPWNAIQFPLDGVNYTVAYLTDPENPEGANFSERLYGRFGEYFPYEVTEDDPLQVRYRWFVQADGDIARETIEQYYRQLAQPPTIMVDG
jgi:hypothetical protein